MKTTLYDKNKRKYQQHKVIKERDEVTYFTEEEMRLLDEKKKGNETALIDKSVDISDINNVTEHELLPPINAKANQVASL